MSECKGCTSLLAGNRQPLFKDPTQSLNIPFNSLPQLLINKLNITIPTKVNHPSIVVHINENIVNINIAPDDPVPVQVFHNSLHLLPPALVKAAIR